MERKLNNKGFSLVELIIVVAIMVVLIGVTSVVILNYMDRSQYGKDMTALDSLHTAIKAYVAEPDSITPESDEVVTLKELMAGADDGTIYDPSNVLASVLSETFNITKTGATVSSCKFKGESRVFKDINWEDILVTISNGSISIVVPVNDEYSKYPPYTAGQYAWTAAQKVKE